MRIAPKVTRMIKLNVQARDGELFVQARIQGPLQRLRCP